MSKAEELYKKHHKKLVREEVNRLIRLYPFFSYLDEDLEVDGRRLLSEAIAQLLAKDFVDPDPTRQAGFLRKVISRGLRQIASVELVRDLASDRTLRRHKAAGRSLPTFTNLSDPDVDDLYSARGDELSPPDVDTDTESSPAFGCPRRPRRRFRHAEHVAEVDTREFLANLCEDTTDRIMLERLRDGYDIKDIAEELGRPLTTLYSRRERLWKRWVAADPDLLDHLKRSGRPSPARSLKGGRYDTATAFCLSS